MTLTIVLVILCWALAAICNAVMDVLAFKYKTSIFKNLNEDYWNPAKSWRNKYKNKSPKNGPAFFGSTTHFSFITDAWHLFQFLSNNFLALSVIFIFLGLTNLNWYIIVGLFFVLKFTWGVFFEIFYSKVFRSYKK